MYYLWKAETNCLWRETNATYRIRLALWRSVFKVRPGHASTFRWPRAMSWRFPCYVVVIASLSKQPSLRLACKWALAVASTAVCAAATDDVRLYGNCVNASLSVKFVDSLQTSVTELRAFCLSWKCCTAATTINAAVSAANVFQSTFDTGIIANATGAICDHR